MKDVTGRTRAAVSTPPWEQLLLVCKDCAKRGDAAPRLKAKEVASELKRAAKAVLPRPRVVLTSCLGVCPKGAITVACAGNGGAARVAEVRKLPLDGSAGLLLGTP